MPNILQHILSPQNNAIAYFQHNVTQLAWKQSYLVSATVEKKLYIDAFIKSQQTAENWAT